MNKKVFWLTIISLVIASVTGCSNGDMLSDSLVENSIESTSNQENWQMVYETTMKRDILCLMMAYPEHIVGVEKEEDDKVYVVMKSGKKLIYDDGVSKNFQQRLANPDLQDMMDQMYPIIPINNLMPEDFDPGRVRSYPILQEVYGGNKNEVEANLGRVQIGYKRLAFNKSNNAAEELKKVMKELADISQNNWKVGSNVYPSSGTYNYRHIAGTGRLSPHSFGIAVDLKRDKKDYWKWASNEQGAERIKEYPKEIVQVFEDHNFVWGGKWYHFDILHFEYRPEIVLKGKFFSKQLADNDPWYEGVSLEYKQTKEFIKLIEEVL